jgi:tRNA(Ile)-lysidine synthase TilS/MesJ
MNDIIIPSPPWKKGGKLLEKSVRKALYDFHLIDDATAIAVALSGGKDSLTLLFMLNHILGRGFVKKNLYAIHVEGPFSCGASVDKNYLHNICKQLNVTFIPLELDKNIKLENLNCYTCSRLRRTLIFKKAKELNISHVAFGHHQDDNIQTLVLNLWQKGSFEGILPKLYMQKYGITIIRPLIYIRETDIVSFAKNNDFMRQICKCPRGQVSKRKEAANIIAMSEEAFPLAKRNLSSAVLTYGSQKAKKCF